MPKITKPNPDQVLIKSLEDQVTSLDENWKRALADYQNLLKRIETDKTDFVKFATMNLISKFLPSLDILTLAATHSQDAGVKMAVKQFQDVLKSEGLEDINPGIGSGYDHLLHECIETTAGESDNTIAEVVTIGYKIGDFVIRPAKVKVNKIQI